MVRGVGNVAGETCSVARMKIWMKTWFGCVVSLFKNKDDPKDKAQKVPCTHLRCILKRC